MNAIVPVQIHTMSSREIADLTVKRHPDVKRDCDVMFKELNLDVSKFAHIYLDTMNRKQSEYLLPLDLVETLITGYSIKLRHAVLNRLRELEEAVKQNAISLPNFSNPAEAARAWADEMEAKQIAQQERDQAVAQVDVLQPKAQALEVLSQNRNGYLCLTDAAKHLHVKLKDLTNLLANKKFIYRRATSSPLKKGKWAAYERAIQKGWLFHDYVAGEKPDGTDYAPQVLVTPKGLALIAEIVSQEKGILV